MRAWTSLLLLACVDSGDVVRPPPGGTTLQLVGDDVFIGGPAERPTVAVQPDRVMIAYEHGGIGVQTAKFSLFDWDYNPIALRQRVSAERSNHVQVAASPWGWTLAWVRTGHTRLSMRALDVDGVPRQRPRVLRSSNFQALDYPDIYIDEQGEGLAIWSEENAGGTGYYGVRQVHGNSVGRMQNRMDGYGHIAGPPCICGGEGSRLIGWQARSRPASAVLFQSVDELGSPAHPVVVVDQSPESRTRPACEHIEGGGWVVGWRSMDGRGVHQGTFLRFLNEDGTPSGPIWTVDPLGEGVALTSVGDDILVTWRDYDSDGAGISAQLWSASAQAPTSDITRVNQQEIGDQSSVDVGMWADANGDLHGLFSWHDGGGGVSTRTIWARRFSVLR